SGLRFQLERLQRHLAPDRLAQSGSPHRHHGGARPDYRRNALAGPLRVRRPDLRIRPDPAARARPANGVRSPARTAGWTPLLAERVCRFGSLPPGELAAGQLDSATPVRSVL